MKIERAGFTDDGDILTAIEIDFERHSEDPGRVFRAMSDLIEALYQFDVDLVRSINIRVDPKLLLQEVETGSIRTWLRTVLLQTNDEALITLDWKPLVGQYLVKAKYKALEWLDDKKTITDRSQVKGLQRDLLKLAEDTSVAALPTFEPIPEGKLLDDLRRVGNGLAQLHAGDGVVYISPEGKLTVNREFRVTSDQIEELLTKEIISGESELLLMVKKPDYLGESKWEFRYQERAIEAKILDEEWLRQFQSRGIDVRPGDCLRARVRADVRRGFDGAEVSKSYFVLEVIEVVPAERQSQIPLLPPPSDQEP